MNITRRDFIKYCSVAAGALGLSAASLMKLKQVMAKVGGLHVVWLQGAACTGCTVSFANSIYYATLAELLLLNNHEETNVDLHYHSTLMSSMGTQATQQSSLTTSGFLLVVEGAIQTGANGNYCQVGDFGAASETMKDVVTYFATHANCGAILCAGTCSSFGGIPAAAGNVTGAKGFLEFMNATQTTDNYRAIRSKTINVPGCPPNPNWIVGVIAYILANGLGFPQLDALRRPRLYYGERLCNYCARLNKTNFVGVNATLTYNRLTVNEPERIGDPNQNTDAAGYCLKMAGCKGSRTKGDCSWRKWNSPGYTQMGVNWCVGAGAPCQGCTQNFFPDRMSPFHYIR